MRKTPEFDSYTQKRVASENESAGKKRMGLKKYKIFEKPGDTFFEIFTKID
jgi:hypothetical protein